MKNLETTPNGKKLINFLDKKMCAGEFENNDLVQFIEVVGQYLGLQTISDYAKSNNLSYNGARDYRNTQTIFNVKFVIDNQ